jgi:hypothetical protein
LGLRLRRNAGGGARQDVLLTHTDADIEEVRQLEVV